MLPDDVSLYVEYLVGIACVCLGGIAALRVGHAIGWARTAAGFALPRPAFAAVIPRQLWRLARLGRINVNVFIIFYRVCAIDGPGRHIAAPW
jgi:hypothetical protein